MMEAYWKLGLREGWPLGLARLTVCLILVFLGCGQDAAPH
jgi:hypothetical protein